MGEGEFRGLEGDVGMGVNACTQGLGRKRPLLSPAPFQRPASNSLYRLLGRQAALIDLVPVAGVVPKAARPAAQTAAAQG